MIGHALNGQNDIFLENGSFKLVDGAAETVQHVRTRLQFYYGEWFLDTQAGTPYFEQVFIKPVNLANIESLLKQRILETPGVERLIEFTMDFDRESRVLRVNFSAETIYGAINNEQVTINA